MTRWHIIRDGKAVAWDVTPGDLHTDDIEMAGFGCAHVVFYGNDENGFVLTHHPIFPTLRARPNNTHATCQFRVGRELLPQLCIDGMPASETLTRVELDGTVTLYTAAGLCNVTHICYPSVDKRMCFELVTVKNNGDVPVALTVTAPEKTLHRVMGPMGYSIFEYHTDFAPNMLMPGAAYTYAIKLTGRVANEPIPDEDAIEALCRRRARIGALTAPMQLDTGNETLDTMFRFAKLRAGESVFDTRFGYGKIHSPGGFNYYAATWCNDQVEYAGPYFGYTGDAELLEAAMNAYRM